MYSKKFPPNIDVSAYAITRTDDWTFDEFASDEGAYDEFSHWRDTPLVSLVGPTNAQELAETINVPAARPQSCVHVD